MLNKIGTFFSRLNYSHIFNVMSLSQLHKDQKENLKVLYDTRMKVISDFRNAHMNIIAGLIALLGFIGKEEIMKNIIAYRFFMYFIIGSILYLVVEYYANIIGFKNQIDVLRHNLSLTEMARKKAKNFSLDKNAIINISEQEMKLNYGIRKTISIIIGLFGLSIWGCFIIGIYYFLNGLN